VSGQPFTSLWPAAMKQAMSQAGWLSLIALVPALAAAALVHPQWKADALLEGEIALAEASSKQPAVLWVDARPAADFAKDHIPGALPLNEDAWAELLPDVLQKWNPGQSIVVYCSSKSCHASLQVAKRLREVGLSPVHALHGGWEAWGKR
jgi:rhodanese-related sulfurtransferase